MLNLFDYPKKLERALYDQAARAYAGKVSKRARAVYVVGNITYPGLSDLDLLVITGIRRRDNAQYFSPVHRMHERFEPVFLHGPLVVPAVAMDALRFTTHGRRRLLAGEDVLRGCEFVETPAEQWCKVLEGYCTYAAFVRVAESGQPLRARRLIAKASSLRFTLRQVDALCGSDMALDYGTAIDDVRAAYFDTEPGAAVLSVWQLFRNAYDRMTAVLRTLLPLRADENIDDFARRLFSGSASFDRTPEAYLVDRCFAVDQYQTALKRLDIPFGQMFFAEAHQDRWALYRQPSFQYGLYRVKYKIERMLDARRAYAADEGAPIMG
jgi:hypothetical protein